MGRSDFDGLNYQLDNYIRALNLYFLYSSVILATETLKFPLKNCKPDRMLPV